MNVYQLACLLMRIVFSVFILFFASLLPVYAQESSGDLYAFERDPVWLEMRKSSRVLNQQRELLIDFIPYGRMCGKHYKTDWYSQCRPALNLQGKSISNEHLRFEPPIAGSWHFNSDYNLQFTPTEPWKSGQAYALYTESGLFPEYVTLDRKYYVIRTEALVAKIKHPDFIQDQEDEQKRFVSATITFNYPMVRKTVESALSFSLNSEKRHQAYRKKPRISWRDDSTMHLEIDAPKLGKEQFLSIEIAEGIEPKHGGKPLQQSVIEHVRIPNTLTHLRVTDISSHITHGVHPRQTLSVTLNNKTTTADIANHIEAYLLPKHHPLQANNPAKGDKAFGWQAASQVSDDILAQSTAITLTPIKSAIAHITHQFTYEAEAGRYLYVRVKQGMPSFANFRLGKHYNAVAMIADIEKELYLVQAGALMPFSGSKNLSIASRGIDNIDVEIGRIKPEFMSQIIAQYAPNFSRLSYDSDNIPWRSTEHINSELVAHITELSLPVSNVSRDQLNYSHIDLSDYLGKDSKGIFVVKLKNRKASLSLQRFLFISDLALIVKETHNEQREVFVLDLADGKPAINRIVEVLGRNGSVIFQGRTDKNGHVALPDLRQFIRHQSPTVITAYRADDHDFSFIGYKQNDTKLNFSRFDVGGYHYQEGLTALLFSDRGIYQPGETVHMGTLIRNSEATQDITGLPLFLSVKNPQQKTVYETVLHVPENGLDALSFTLESHYIAGTYRVGLYVAKPKGDGEYRKSTLIGAQNITVQEFISDRLKVDNHFILPKETTGKSYWFKADQITEARVTLRNLYGKVAVDHVVKSSIDQNSPSFSFDGYSGYQFWDSYGAEAFSNIALPDAQTNTHGEVHYPLDINELTNGYSYQLRLNSNGFEHGSGRRTYTSDSVIISPMEYIIGSKIDADIDQLQQNKPYALQLIALDANGKKQAVSGAKFLIKKRHYINNLERNYNGEYYFNSTIEDVAISQPESISLPTEGSTIEIPTHEVGEFVLEMRDNHDRVITSRPFTVRGKSSDKRLVNKEAELTITTDKEDYRNGDLLTLTLNTPYEGSGLITLESDSVHHHQWFEATTGVHQETIKIPSDINGKLYVNVAYARSTKSTAIYTPPLTYAVRAIYVNLAEYELDITLNAPKSVTPGDPLTIDYAVNNDDADIILYAVDEGILQRVNYRMPNPLRYFFKEQALGVVTYQMLNQIMPDYDLVTQYLATGGGVENAFSPQAPLKRSALLNAFGRQKHTPVIWWSGVLSSAKGSVSFTVPDHFNGALRIMAVATDGRAVGHQTASTLSQADVIIQSAMPTHVIPGDQFDLTATIHNYGKHSADTHIELELPEHLTLLDDVEPEQIYSITKDGQLLLRWRLQAQKTLGSAQVVITASTESVSAKSTATTSVRPASINSTTLINGRIKGNMARLDVGHDLYDAFAEQSITLSSLPVNVITGLKRYLDQFPYGCTEQMISKLFPLVTLYDHPDFELDKAEIRKRLNYVVSQLRNRGHYDGGIQKWHWTHNSHDFTTLYAVDFMGQAWNKELPIPSDLYSGALHYLRNFVNRRSTSYSDAKNQAYGIYLLTRNGIITTDYVVRLVEFLDENHPQWRGDMHGVYIAATYEMLLLEEEADALITEFKAPLEQFRRHDSYYDSFISLSQYISILARHFPEKLQKTDPKLIHRIAAWVNEGRYNTVSAAYGINALHDYMNVVGVQAVETLKLDALLADKTTLPIGGNGTQIYQAAIPSDATSLQVNSPATRDLFYQITRSGFARDIAREAESNGLYISHRYVDDEGEPVSDVVIGDTITVEISLHTSGKPYQDIAIVDLLPGGFALVNDSLPPSSASFYADGREDRVIMYSEATHNPTSRSYQIQATYSGEFIIPPPYAQHMYDLSINGRGEVHTINVRNE